MHHRLRHPLCCDLPKGGPSKDALLTVSSMRAGWAAPGCGWVGDGKQHAGRLGCTRLRVGGWLRSGVCVCV